MVKVKSTKTKSTKTTPTLWNKVVADYIKKTGKPIPKKGSKDYKALKANYEAAKLNGGGTFAQMGKYFKRKSRDYRATNAATKAARAKAGGGSLYSTYV